MKIFPIFVFLHARLSFHKSYEMKSNATITLHLECSVIELVANAYSKTIKSQPRFHE